MKKVVLVFLAFGLCAMMFSSCSTSKSCPAYGDTYEVPTEEAHS